MKENKTKKLFRMLLFVFTFFLIVGEMNYIGAETDKIQTTTTTTAVEKDDGTTVTTEKTETQTQPEKKKEEHHSVLGSFFGFIGNVIAFPFRMIGHAWNAIF